MKGHGRPGYDKVRSIRVFKAKKATKNAVSAKKAAKAATKAPASYRRTTGYCRHGPKWGRSHWHCLRGRKSNEACAKECDAHRHCGAYDRENHNGHSECCLFKPGNRGQGSHGR